MNKKRVLAAALALCLMVGTAAVAAGELMSISVVPGMNLRINGQTVTPTDVNGKPVEVFAYEGTTYVPIRFISEAYGMKVDYEADTKTAVVNGGNTVTGTSKGFGDEVITVALTVSGGKITDASASSTGTSAIPQSAAALSEMPKAMKEKNTVEVDGVSGATGTSTAILAAARQAMAQITENSGAGDLDAWALANGYVKAADYGIVAGVDAVSGATEAKMGGVNYGAIEWSTELQQTAIREFLKGGKYLGSADYAQDDSGYNYREMYQMATSYNNKPSNTNLELVLDAKSLSLVGVSEAGTGKTLQFAQNPEVSVSWCKQLRLEDEENGYNYYCSYGVQFNGKVRVFTSADFDTTEGQDAILNLFDVYYPTLASTWMGYSAALASASNAQELRAAKLAYAKKTIEAGTMVAYEIVPERIVITAPFLMNMIPQMSNAVNFTTVLMGGAHKYAYNLDLTEDFLDKLIEYKNSVLATAEGKAAVEAYYTSPMYQMLDGACAQMGVATTSLQAALASDNAAGLKTQTTYIPGK